MRHLSGGLTVVRAQFAPNSVQFSSVRIGSVAMRCGGVKSWVHCLNGHSFPMAVAVEFIIPQQAGPVEKWAGSMERCQTVGKADSSLKLKNATLMNLFATLNASESKQRKIMFINIKIALFAFRRLSFIQPRSPAPSFRIAHLLHSACALAYWHCRRDSRARSLARWAAPGSTIVITITNLTSCCTTFVPFPRPPSAISLT